MNIAAFGFRGDSIRIILLNVSGFGIGLLMKSPMVDQECLRPAKHRGRRKILAIAAGGMEPARFSPVEALR
jgi:hypothetical protein